MTGISINKKIHSILTSDATLSGMCQSIYPLIAEEDVSYPFVLFTRQGVAPKDTKGYVVGDSVDFAIAIVSDKYSETVNIAERIRVLFEKRRDSYFSECNLTGCDEGYQENAFVQHLYFNALILNNITN